jgi:DNA (cytosine-5)-methyltransferase 1
MPTHLDLFSGIGGFALAAREAGFRTVAFCETDPYCQRVLGKNFNASVAYSKRNGSHRTQADAPEPRSDWQNNGVFVGSRVAGIWPDIGDLDGVDFRGVDLLTGGFPCQPFSCAGKRRGAADDRHLWPEMLRVIKEARPAWVLGENVPGIETMEFRRSATRVEDHPALGSGDEEVYIYCESALVLDACVRTDLESLGYSFQPFSIPAVGVDAKHKRDRLWIVAHDSRIQSIRKKQWSKRQRAGSRGLHSDISYPSGVGCGSMVPSIAGRSQSEGAAGKTSDSCESAGPARWLPEPDVGRVAHGIPFRVDRLRGLGNAIVPQVAFEILREIRRYC